ncbi:MAG TPA: M1 family aminopeptidase, partial [Puia sp.]|nr:M1 family aminopeptidase [Puia sp.]
YNEFGRFDVRITLPKNYVVAATGELQNEDETEWMVHTEPGTRAKIENLNRPNQSRNLKQLQTSLTPLSDKQTKTLQYTQVNADDFVWFADKNFIVVHDTIKLESGKQIDVYLFHLPEGNTSPNRIIQYIKHAVQFRSSLIGAYPYNVVSAVEEKSAIGGGMQYPTVTCIPPQTTQIRLEATIEHAVGYNWFYSALGSNARQDPWMEEGMNSFYDDKFSQQQSGTPAELTISKQNWLQKRVPDDMANTFVQTMVGIKKDQPIQTSAEGFSNFNYCLIAYKKASNWMKLLENYLGADTFADCMKQYYKRWQFKHPYPEDFRKVIEEVSGRNVDSLFALLDKKGMLENKEINKKTRLAFLFNLKETDKYHYVSILPAIGYNMYDKGMIGAVIHNYNLPPNNFQFVLAPLYATNSRQFNGIGKISYSWYPDNKFQKIEIGLNGARFSTNQSLDTNGNKVFENFYKIAPSLKFNFREAVLSPIESSIEFRTYLIGGRTFNQFGVIAGGDSTVSYPISYTNSIHYLNQITFNTYNYRVLYPYDYQIQLLQGAGFYRINLTGNYFFNYAKGGGFNVRLFSAKFGYIGGKSYDVYQFEPKLLAGNGGDDFTYSNYFLGRSASASNPPKPVSNDGLAAQQIMINNGGLKFRLDLFSFLQGSSDNWVAAVNINTSLPES